MATLLASPLSPVEVNQHNAALRRRRAAIEEMRRNGVVISPEWAHEVDNPRPELPALNVRDIGLDDFVSLPDAKAMSKSDICNVEPCSEVELRETLATVAAQLGATRCKYAYDDWESGADWPDDDVRWTLTPAELKKLQSFA